MVLIGLIVVIVLVVIIVSLLRKRKARRDNIDAYNRTKYAQVTGNTIDSVLADDGLYGEYLIGIKLQRFAPSCPTFFNLYIPMQNGGTSEIDVLLVHPTAVFVFESKNYSGWIFGNEADSKWTQSLNKNSKFQFANPIRQNEGHVRALQAYLGLGREAFYSVVVFGNACELMKVTSSSIPVLQTCELPDFLHDTCGSLPQRFDVEERNRIVRLLVPCAHVSEDVKRRHIERLTGGESGGGQVETNPVVVHQASVGTTIAHQIGNESMQTNQPDANSTNVDWVSTDQANVSQNSDDGYWKHTQPYEAYFGKE